MKAKKMIERCECGNFVYSSDLECPYCGRRLEFGSDETPQTKKERQLELFSPRKERQRKLFKC